MLIDAYLCIRQRREKRRKINQLLPHWNIIMVELFICILGPNLWAVSSITVSSSYL